MKIIRLPQPLASLVVTGALPFFPSFEEHVEHDEYLFIYAEEYNENFKDKLHKDIPYHRLILNHITFDNLPSPNTIPTNAFVGYVQCDKVEPTDFDIFFELNFIHVYKPRVFVASVKSIQDNKMSYYNCISENPRINRVEVVPINRIENLYEIRIPLNEICWNQLRDIDNYNNNYKCLSLFWEEYMGELGSKDDKTGLRNQNISQIRFCHRNSSIVFPSKGDVRRKQFGKRKNPGFYLGLDLGQVDLSDDRWRQFFNLELCAKEEMVIREEKPKEYTPWVRFISSPMGGMNKYRR